MCSSRSTTAGGGHRMSALTGAVSAAGVSPCSVAWPFPGSLGSAAFAAVSKHSSRATASGFGGETTAAVDTTPAAATSSLAGADSRHVVSVVSPACSVSSGVLCHAQYESASDRTSARVRRICSPSPSLESRRGPPNARSLLLCCPSPAEPARRPTSCRNMDCGLGGRAAAAIAAASAPPCGWSCLRSCSSPRSLSDKDGNSLSVSSAVTSGEGLSAVEMELRDSVV